MNSFFKLAKKKSLHHAHGTYLLFMGHFPSLRVKKHWLFFNFNIFSQAYVVKCHLGYKGNSDIRESFLSTNVSLISEFDCTAKKLKNVCGLCSETCCPPLLQQQHQQLEGVIWPQKLQLPLFPFRSVWVG